MRRSVGIAAMVLLGTAALAVGAPAGEKVLKIGVSATYTGGFAAVGQHISDGQIDYLNWLSKNGGIAYTDPASGQVETVRLEVLVEDNQYSAVQAVQAYNRFRDAGANAILGFGSTPGEACAAAASRDKLPYLSWYAYASPAGYRPTPRYYWSFLPSVAESATPMIRWFITQKWKGVGSPKIGIMAADLPSWQVLKKPGLMENYVSHTGGILAGMEFFPIKSPDLTLPAARLVIEKEVDCLILIGALPNTVLLARNLRQLGVNLDKTTVVCSLSAWDESLFQSAAVDIEGMYGEVHMVSVTSDAVGMKRVQKVAAHAGRDPNKLVMNYTNGLVGAMTLETAIRRALEKKGFDAVAADGQAIRNELEGFNALDTMGLCPSVEVRYEDEPFFLNAARMVQAKAGAFESVSDWIGIDRLVGAMD